MKKIKVGILGATGAVGQRFVQLLENHPWFEVTALCASEKSAGKLYKDIVNWKVSETIPSYAANMKVGLCNPKIDAKIVFSGLDSSVAGEIEDKFARMGYIVVSNSKNHRMDDYVPLLIPEVNPEHIEQARFQKTFKSGGFIVTNPNCTTIGLAMVLKPLHDAFGIKRIMVTSMQALSGAGYPGVSSMDILDNVVPYISGEEEKVEIEPRKLLGSLNSGKVDFADIAISASCNRVNVRDGHLESVTLEFIKKPTEGQIIKVLENFRGE
ncbi:MAG TPA: aspartate-semialdehyde dehydrogenase, partial [Candidatus Saccharimonadales bacterium]|nr:aspartate-semialdehyde dehydrogenase [Candidatus Saccharimonadales bacterium]